MRGLHHRRRVALEKDASIWLPNARDNLRAAKRTVRFIPMLDLRPAITTQAPSLTLRLRLRSSRFLRHCLGFGSRKREVIQNVVLPHVARKYYDEFRDLIIQVLERMRHARGNVDDVGSLLDK